MSARIRLRINGVEEEWDEGVTLARMLEQKGLDRRFLVVEYNGEPLGRDRLDGVELHDGDRLELVRPVAGG